MTISAILGAAEALTDAEVIDLMSYEMVIENGWATFVDVGLALAQIRERRLYRNGYLNFDAYCRIKWQYGRHYVNRLISASQVFSALVTGCHQAKPQHEAQVRPLVGLKAEDACRVWDYVAEKAGKRRISSANVRNAMQLLHVGSPPDRATAGPRVNRTELRSNVDRAVGELLVLISQRADYGLLSKKVEELHGHFRQLFPAKEG